MRAARFLETRKPAWDRLAALMERCRGRVSVLSDDELHELTRLYPGVAVDVARARRYRMDAKTQERLNGLAIAAHGMLYRRKHRPALPAIWRFLAVDYPRLFRKLWPYTVLAAALLLVTGLGTFVTVTLRPSTAYLFIPRGLNLPDGKAEVTAEDISERFRRIPKPPMATGIMANNISVAFKAFAFGISAGVGTCYVILVNGTMLGAFIGHFANHGLGYELMCFIFPHGFLEIFAIVVAAAAGLRLGLSLSLPGRLTRGASLKAGAREAVLLVLGTIPMFIVAGAIEGFVTPTFLPGSVKIAVGAGTGGAAILYLLTFGLRKDPARQPATIASSP